MSRPIRVLIAKPGLDGHDRGAKVIALALRQAGFEVIYTGLHQTAEQIVEAALEEDVDAIGVSVLSGAHLTVARKIMETLRAAGMGDIVVLFGGNIPTPDISALKELGVDEVFPTGSRFEAIEEFVRSAVAGRRAPTPEPEVET